MNSPENMHLKIQFYGAMDGSENFLNFFFQKSIQGY